MAFCTSRSLLCWALAALALSTGAAFAQDARTDGAGQAGQDQTGLATWYGEDFDGRTTAEGDRFDMYGLTAAHANLPFDSIIEVTNLGNGRKVDLRVNDRRAEASGTVVVVSKAAAANLGFLQDRSANVRVTVVSLGSGRPQSSRGWTQASN